MSKLKSFWTCKVYQVTHSSVELSQGAVSVEGRWVLLHVPWKSCCPWSTGVCDSTAGRDEDHPFCFSRVIGRGAEPTNLFVGKVPAACWHADEYWLLRTFLLLVVLSAVCQLCHQHCCLLWHHEFLSVLGLFIYLSCFLVFPFKFLWPFSQPVGQLQEKMIWSDWFRMRIEFLAYAWGKETVSWSQKMGR